MPPPAVDTAPPVVTEAKYSCDDCGQDPIVGTRYHCSVCPNFDLCSLCEAKGSHHHPLLKYRSSEASEQPAAPAQKRRRSRAVVAAGSHDEKQEEKVEGNKRLKTSIAQAAEVFGLSRGGKQPFVFLTLGDSHIHLHFEATNKM